MQKVSLLHTESSLGKGKLSHENLEDDALLHFQNASPNTLTTLIWKF